ncbi:hypothetical protein PHLGIDRAFT_379324 [Phlebiopsis gigantea 11061_1 CR5-6]|uniref:Uncharacterized protein n=1 Tax=Phlebiopsis gigantea (strain 11061_1 CR5-6) TaxID=745531 RepID=A0A0C3RP85_PHLG1|nr:hypothetical protein PHLGIDRAFT_379324 [Phlebiopsis gigantea 11061_1 CR5-6]
MSRVWLITGSSSGMGREMTELALQRGDRVAATLRKPGDLQDLQAQYPASQLLVVALDVTDSAQIPRAFAEAKRAFGRVDVVFNNAGRGAIAEVEGIPEATARRVFDVNFWGAANVSNEAVRFFREENAPGAGGRLLVVSSAVAISPIPSLGHYSASKFALEAVTQALAAEIDPEWNIKITLLEPGFVTTPLGGNSDVEPVHPAYDTPTNVSVRTRNFVVGQYDPRTASNVSNLAKIVARMYDAAGLASPPLRLPLGADTLSAVRAQIKSLGENLEQYASLSDGIREE